MSEPVYLTLEGKQELERELEQLRTEKIPELAQKLKEAVSQGDLKENADYHDTREKKSFAEGRLKQIETMLRSAVIIDPDQTSDTVMIGSNVTIRYDGEDDDVTYTIVGAAEANPREGRISNESPIGDALLGHKKGDKVSFKTPEGNEVIVKIRKLK